MPGGGGKEGAASALVAKLECLQLKVRVPGRDRVVTVKARIEPRASHCGMAQSRHRGTPRASGPSDAIWKLSESSVSAIMA
jgi:hypothetical protein